MTVAQLKERYAAIQQESAVIEAELKPLFKRLRSLSKRAERLSNIMLSESRLYKYNPDGTQSPAGWNVQAHCRMDELEEVPVFVNGIKINLYNLRHTPFKKRRERSSR